MPVRPLPEMPHPDVRPLPTRMPWARPPKRAHPARHIPGCPYPAGRLVSRGGVGDPNVVRDGISCGIVTGLPPARLDTAVGMGGTMLGTGASVGHGRRKHGCPSSAAGDGRLIPAHGLPKITGASRADPSPGRGGRALPQGARSTAPPRVCSLRTAPARRRGVDEQGSG